MAQLAKGLPHGGLELFLGTHMKSQVWLILVISALGEQGPLGFNDQIDSLKESVRSRFRKRPVTKNKVESVSGNTMLTSGLHMYVYAWAHGPANIPTCTHTDRTNYGEGEAWLWW